MLVTKWSTRLLRIAYYRERMAFDYKKLETPLGVAVRIITGLMFFLHGWAKVTGGSDLSSLLWFAAIVELVAGAAFVLGVFVRLSSVAGAIVMIGAYTTVHAPQALSPLANKGELALLYLAMFLIFAFRGPMALSLERLIFGKDRF